jgi:maleate isomerase
VATYGARLANEATITPETLRAMRDKLADCANVILPGMSLDVIGYGCTSGSLYIGEDEVKRCIRSVRPEAKTTNPVTAALAAFAALNTRSFALLTPYRDEINQELRNFFESNGFAVPVMGSFNEEDDNKVGQMTPECIGQAVLKLGKHEAVDAVFVSCTNLRIAAEVQRLEVALGKPITSSNHALAWHCLRLAGVNDALPQFGQLYTV